MPFIEDFSSFFDPDDFGTLADINGVEVAGILGNEGDEDQGVSGTRPMFTCATADVALVTNLDALYVNDKDYEIVEKRDDGTGITRLILQDAS